VPGGHVKNGIMAFVNGGSVPKFSKYVGVQEWANCVLLMFNLSASSKGQTYTNSFVGQPGGGMHVTYYLSDRSIILPLSSVAYVSSAAAIWICSSTSP